VSPNRSATEIAAVWTRFHEQRRAEAASRRQVGNTSDELPLVSICITQYRRPHFLGRLIAVVAAQTYPNFEIIIVDDGSNDPASSSALDALERDASIRVPLRIRRIENAYLGAARNAAAKIARGDFLKFQDDDNLPLPTEVEFLIRAARTTGADVVTCFAYQFRGAPPEKPSIDDIHYFPLGTRDALGYLRNEFGDANALVRASTFRELGGFTEDRDVGCEDYEFFARCTSTGRKVVCVPEPLFFYRVSSGSMLQDGSVARNVLRGRRGFAEMPAEALKVFADIELGRNIADQVKVAAWYRTGGYEHGWLHQQLLDGDPNSDLADTRIANLLGHYGRVDDGLRYLMEHRSITAAFDWKSEVGTTFAAKRNERVIQVESSDRQDALYLRGLATFSRECASSAASFSRCS
jgi:GT2 family glycosyltransferase